MSYNKYFIIVMVTIIKHMVNIVEQSWLKYTTFHTEFEHLSPVVKILGLVNQPATLTTLQQDCLALNPTPYILLVS